MFYSATPKEYFYNIILREKNTLKIVTAKQTIAPITDFAVIGAQDVLHIIQGQFCYRVLYWHLDQIEGVIHLKENNLGGIKTTETN